MKDKGKIIAFLKQPLIYILIFCIFMQIQIYKTIPESVMAFDSHTYAEGYTKSIFKGELDYQRTPIYPYIIKVIKKIGGEQNLINNVVIFQKILFIFTLILFYYCLKKIINNKIILTVFTIIFGICPFIIFWNIYVLTESLALFEIVALLLITINYLKKPNVYLAVGIGFFIIIMIMTRPSFVYLLPIYMFFWIVRIWLKKNEKKENIAGVISCAVSISILLFYCTLIKMQYGEFAITSVSYVNNAVSIIDSNSYKYAQNDDMIKIIDEIKAKNDSANGCFDALNELLKYYTVDEIKEFTKSAIKNDSNLLEFFINKTIKLGMVNTGTIYSGSTEKYKDIDYIELANLIWPINFAITYIILIISVLNLIWKFLRYKDIDWILYFFTILIIANLFTLIVGAPFESQRLFFSSIAPLMLLIAYTFGKNLLRNYK